MREDISKFVLTLRRSYPFLGSLALFAEYQFNAETEMFNTNGRVIRINPDYFDECQADQKTGLLLHLLLHCALLHVVRRGNRDRRLWGIASDIAVNNIILEGGHFPAPKNTSVDTGFSEYSTEEIYEQLLLSDRSKNSTKPQQSDNARSKSQIKEADHLGNSYHPDLESPDAKNETLHKNQIEQHWRSAQQRASTADRLRSRSRGSLPQGFAREWDIALKPKLDWKTMLWRYLVKTPYDFAGFDRRFMHQGLYLEELIGETLSVDIAVDTSGSIDEQELGQFLAEVTAITQAYAQISVRLYYVDSAVNGPYKLDELSTMPVPIGNGGTDFETFFVATQGAEESLQPPLCIYFTDGDGAFPRKAPRRPLLWVLVAGGVSDHCIPFGQVTRLSYI